MAATITPRNLCFSPSFWNSPTTVRSNPKVLFFGHSPRRSTTSLRTFPVSGPDLLGDLGARDPFPAEIESGFADKVLGNVDTEHKILIPNAAALSLAQQDCIPISHLQQPMSEDEAKKLLFKVNLNFPSFFAVKMKLGNFLLQLRWVFIFPCRL